MAKADAVIVHPVPGRYLSLPRGVSISAPSDIAARLVRTGAYTTVDPGGLGEPVEFVDPGDLDFYDNPRAPASAGAETQPEE